MVEVSATPEVRESAKAVVVNPHTMAALVLRLNEKERQERKIDEWHIPGGSRGTEDNPEESFVDAALREVEEETGLKSDQLEYLGELGGDVWDAFYEGKPTHFVAKFLGFVLKDGVSPDNIVIGEESSEWAWVTEADMMNYPALTTQARRFIPQAVALVEARDAR
jgi:8-oxo-dGTP pyrophosphatase MutT (NUDIX family)